MTIATPLPPRASPRRQRVPPAITRGSEPMPALHVVDEIPGDLGVVLWRSVRNVLLWAHTPAERRASLFDPGAAAARAAELGRAAPEAELLAPLSVVVALLENPARVEVRRLVHACRRVSAWAEGQGALGTALEFAQAAALAAAEDASLAVGVGRLARRRAEYDRAESWYLRAIVLGRQRRDWRSYALGYLGLGSVHMQKGNYPAARRMLHRSLRAATRRAVCEVRGMACHDLFLCDVETGAGLEASAMAIEAARAYGPTDPRVPRLAYDLAYHWVLLGCFSSALRVAEILATHPDFHGVAERVLVLGLVARAAGGAGDRAAFARAVTELEPLLARYERVQGDDAARENASGALLGLAHGANSLGEKGLAVASAERGLALARSRGQGRVVLAAEAALEAMSRSVAPERVPAKPESTGAGGFADDMVRVLTAAPRVLSPAG